MKKRAITAATYNVIVQIGSLIGSRMWLCLQVITIASVADKFPQKSTEQRTLLTITEETKF